MGERKHKAEGGEKKDKVSQGKNTNSPVTHPILQLQQTIGNKAVTNLIQRHPKEMMNNYNWKVYSLADGKEVWLSTETLEHSQKRSRTR